MQLVGVLETRKDASVRVCFDGVEERGVVLADDEADSKAVGSEVLHILSGFFLIKNKICRKRTLLNPHKTCTKPGSIIPVVSIERTDSKVTASGTSGFCQTESAYISSLIRWILCR